MEKSLYYKTKDLVLATTLKCFCSEEFRGIEEKPTEKQVFEFVFDNTNEIIELIGKFQRGELLVEPQTYSSIFRLLKNMIYNAKQ